ncbi:hypothetical protein [Advenella mimigardefordensis]|uniref:Uncharacterized protein n=1 Tax=Advenella mimigardefordensis (strain DSM 17166 / LMG 22922 / DPN7) TaxID=1247726 RepID=W0PKR5_ADVMD|nr:hypothetical protein [Advenella mimigardefordensis]AHG65583.1 hypothetical protein MIM_c35230 [Advenella mimigardefordensis DPN7]
MRIREPDGFSVDIFSIYWFGKETYFYGMPKNYGGLQAYKAEDVAIIDNNIGFKTVFFSKGDAKSVHHWDLIQESLLDDLLELDETAYKRFVDILKSEGQLDDSFY